MMTDVMRIEAVVRAELKWKVADSLTEAKIPYTMYDVEGIGTQLGEKASAMRPYRFSTHPKTMILVYIERKSVERVKEIIEDAAHTGRMGDGIIAVSSLEEAIRIRTRERLVRL